MSEIQLLEHICQFIKAPILVITPSFSLLLASLVLLFITFSLYLCLFTFLSFFTLVSFIYFFASLLLFLNSLPAVSLSC